LFLSPYLHIFPGPAFWGLINPEWSLCNKGRRQSPVNLEPQRLLFDPNLRPLHIDKHRVSWNFAILHARDENMKSSKIILKIKYQKNFIPCGS
jgi:carbonic anhydrase